MNYFYKVFSLLALIPVIIVYLKWKKLTKEEKIWLSIISLIIPFLLMMAYFDDSKKYVISF